VRAKNYSRAQVIPRSSGLKTMARSIGRRSHSSVARQAMRSPKIRAVCLNVLEKDIQKDLTNVASTRQCSSCLRENTLGALENFSWEKLHAELRLTAPTFYRILEACVNVKRRKRVTKKKPRMHCPSNSAVLGVCAALVLRHRNRNLNLVQRIVSLILHSGHSSKKVLLYPCIHVRTCT